MRLGTYFAATILGASLLASGPAFSEITSCPAVHAAKGLCFDIVDVKGKGHDKHQGKGKGHDKHRGKGHHKNQGEGHDRDGDWDRDDDHDHDRDYDRTRGDRIEQLRENAYEKGYRDGVRDSWRVGERVPRDRYRVVPDYNQYGWPAPTNGNSYVYVDDRYYLIEQATGLVLDILTR